MTIAKVMIISNTNMSMARISLNKLHRAKFSNKTKTINNNTKSLMVNNMINTSNRIKNNNRKIITDCKHLANLTQTNKSNKINK